MQKVTGCIDRYSPSLDSDTCQNKVLLSNLRLRYVLQNLAVVVQARQIHHQVHGDEQQPANEADEQAAPKVPVPDGAHQGERGDHERQPCEEVQRPMVDEPEMLHWIHGISREGSALVAVRGIEPRFRG